MLCLSSSLNIFFLRLKLDHEQRSVTLNRCHFHLGGTIFKGTFISHFRAKITDQWRNILRKAKTVDLRRDVVTLREAFERALEKKKKYIGGLLTELEEGEEQYSMAFRAQMENIERMMGIHQDRLEAQLHQFSTERERLVGESREDKEEMAQKQKESEDYLNDVQIALDQNHSEVGTLPSQCLPSCN